MSQNFNEPTYSWQPGSPSVAKKRSPFINIILFAVTFITTLFAGAEWMSGTMGPHELSVFAQALPYALSILFILACHEFGHYFAARYHKVDVTLPYFIPFPPIPGFLNFGTMGAVIRTRSVVGTNKAMFDIGVTGPIAGFIACLIILIYGFTHLPPVDYLLAIHPDYFSPEYGQNSISLEFGNTLLFSFLRELFTTPDQFVPPMSEVYHYPYLCVGWFGLFVTAMNMIPVGQLDGGHIFYSMFGSQNHYSVAKVSMTILFLLGSAGAADAFFDVGLGFGWMGWLFWCFILYFVIKIKHPDVPHFEKLDSRRMLLGYTAIIILLLSFSPNPIIISVNL
jgi:membrane-associated protease RseP (regulator of RpoE activity)